MKKLISLTLAFALMLCLAVSVSAAGVTLSVSSTKVNPGDEVTVTLTLDETLNGIVSLQYNVYFDNTKFVLSSASNGNAHSAMTLSNVFDDGHYVISLLDPLSEGLTVQAGTLYTLRFKALEGGKADFKIVSKGVLDQDLNKVAVSVSGDVKVTVVCPAHTWDSGKVTQQKDCVNDEITEFTCTVCGETKTETTAPATGHSYGDWVVDKEPTCTEEGSKSQACANCGDKKSEPVPATGHSYGEWVVDKEPTCMEEGSKSQTCAACGDKKTESVPATGHTWGPWEQVDEKEHKKVCTVCKAEEKGEHTWTLSKEVSPDCKNDGYKEYTCDLCRGVKKETVPATGAHNYTEWKDNGNGTHTGTCKGCGGTKTEDHAFGSWEVTKPATCQEPGEEKRVCVCGASETRVIPVSQEHTYDGKWIDNKDGKTHTQSCSVCGKVPVTKDHVWDSGKVTTPATCSTDGEKTFACKDCGAVKTEVIPATGEHDYTDKYQDSGDGKTHSAYCACGESISEDHDFSINGEIIVKPTSTKEGKQEKLCVCGAKIQVTLPKTAELDNVPKTGDITGQLILGGVAIIAVLVCVCYILKRKLAR